MTLSVRRLSVIGFVAAILLLANAGAIVAWMQGIGLVPLAEHLRAEYVTGTAIAVIVALLVLLPSRIVWATYVRNCPVCDCVLLRQGKYCAECGSRV